MRNLDIERVDMTGRPSLRGSPILFLHGMWHGAWCWAPWQQVFADLGWSSRAISLPGHGASPARGPVRFATMDAYLEVLAAEVAGYPTPPVVVGHSMGGALIQWCLKKVRDDFPAVVLLGSWTAHSTIADGTMGHLKRDPLGFLTMAATWSTWPLVRDPRRAASLLITEGATYTPEDLHARLCPESGLVLSQHNPPLWSPKTGVRSPMLWVAGGRDAAITVEGARRSAAHYGADFHLVPDAGHNLMMERSNLETAASIDAWLTSKLP